MFDELIPGMSKVAVKAQEPETHFSAEEEMKRDESGKVINTEIGPLQTMDYIQRLDVNIATYEQFVVLEIVQAETLGTITRKGFVDGWAQVVAESNGKVTCDWSSQKRLVRSRINRTFTDRDYYKMYYDFAFQIGKEPSQKAINMALAVGLWEALFDPTTHPWRSAHVNWLEAWADYLKEKFGVITVNGAGEEEIEYKRTVSKDLWAQTRLFAAKTMEDETLSFWSEEQAWPGLIDEFVVWCREKGIAVAKNGEGMEVEE
jgi:DCN1-like protein 1/2